MSVVIAIQNSDFTALVDEADEHLVSAHRWIIRGPRKSKYAMNSDGMMMHNLIMPPSDGLVVDHKNGNGLDNRRSNLRLCTPTQNQWNRRKHKPTTSQFKGVRQDKGRSSWRAQIVVHGERIHLGSFSSEREAALQYDRSARIFFGTFAMTNEKLGLLG